ncbi:hypothetical protein [Pseudoxanthomonas sp. CF125]|uniref:hypothetical protein n=1 Tax=Pseudoxanthomonas sp. CF125 TaxID=1855303 RepID=UPI00088C970F|nr:hypothetical protein [Pseudoxanthomonas sp. CF125]SDQ81288.1 hypothetical protein SAMN05216569_2152 [Pseudoxanthomonas sp. CF125]
MARASAFLGDPQRKELVLSGAKAPAAPGDIWWPVNFDKEAISSFCDSNGLAPAFFHFLRALVGPSGEAEVSQSLVDAISVLPLRADTQAVFKGWLLWIWDGREGESLKSVLAGSDAYGPACDLVRLHQLGEGTASRQQWRQARSALVSTVSAGPEQASAANIVAAMGWDFTTTPGAAADLVHTCFSETSTRVREAFGWTDVDGDRVQSAIVRLHTLAGAELGNPPADRSDREAMTRYMEAFNAIVAREETEAEAQAMARMRELGAVGSESTRKLKTKLLDGLFLQVRAAPLVKGEPVYT